MKKKQIVDLVIDSILIVIGIVLLLFPMFNITNVKNLFFGIMCCYAILNLIQFILTRESKDYEGLYSTIISMAIGIVGLSFNFNDPKELAISVVTWTFLMAVAKLIKANYYNDLKDRMWKLRIFTLLAFIVLGVLTSINLYHSSDIQVLVLGFFFFTHGILETIDPLCKYLISRQ